MVSADIRNAAIARNRPSGCLLWARQIEKPSCSNPPKAALGPGRRHHRCTV